MKAHIKLQVTLLCGLSLMVASCSSRVADNGNTSPTTLTVPVTASADPRADVVKAMNGALAAKSYRTHLVLSSSNGTSMTMVGEFVAPDRYHLTRETTLPGRAPVTQEMIIIGKNTYSKTASGQWQKYPVDMSDVLSTLRDKKTIDALSKDAEAKFIGPDVLDGAPMLVYQYTLKNALGTGVNSTSKTWISAADNLPRKTESESDVSVEGKVTKTHTTVTYSDYNADIKIEPPIS